MSSIIIFRTIWVSRSAEWRDAAPGVKRAVWSGVGLLVAATVIIGYGNMLAA